ncbi:hypothetical protein TNCV_1207941 [Trichonephila clavipes]|nr:hypothetical protein TNCV_1207941 [Trichonephila clavipes]
MLKKDGLMESIKHISGLNNSFLFTFDVPYTLSIDFPDIKINSMAMTKNGFFGKVQKRGFTNVGHGTGLAPTDNLKSIDLKDLITNSDRYDEGFVKDMLSVIVEERTATEKEKLWNWRRNRKPWFWLSNEKLNSN